MTLYEALQDMCKGRIIEVGGGCELALVALAKGTYIFEFWRGEDRFEIELTGGQGENAAKIEREFNKFVEEHNYSFDDIWRKEYRKPTRAKK